MAAKGCSGRGGKANGKKYEARRHGGGGKGKRRIRGANAIEKKFETVERRNGKQAGLDGEAEFEQWFEDGAAFGFDPDDLETLVPPSNAAELVAESLKPHKNKLQ